MFTFNPFAENTYVIWDSETKIAAIVDPGMSNATEESELDRFISAQGLDVRMLLLTHAHIDHVLGCAYVQKRFGLLPVGHLRVPETLAMSERAAAMYGISYTPSPEPVEFLAHGDTVALGGVELEVREVPGHAPCHVVFIDHATRQVIGGDVLFKGSVGRVDLPGGDGRVLADRIVSQMYTLPDDYVVHCGHGPTTTIGHEANTNPFVRREGNLGLF
jgi:glyoxylase-like metal-dependent hydrolase (beta-lactamase superfamily II)